MGSAGAHARRSRRPRREHTATAGASGNPRVIHVRCLRRGAEDCGRGARAPHFPRAFVVPIAPLHAQRTAEIVRAEALDYFPAAPPHPRSAGSESRVYAVRCRLKAELQTSLAPDNADCRYFAALAE